MQTAITENKLDGAQSQAIELPPCDLGEIIPAFVHEAKNHIQNMENFAAILRDDDLDRETTSSFLDRIAANAKELSDLMKVFFNPDGGPQISYVTLREVIERAVENAGIKNGENAYVEIFGDDAVIKRKVFLDCLRTKVILRNLLSNALKHSNRSRVHIKVSAYRKHTESSPEEKGAKYEGMSSPNDGGSYIEIAVSDNGRGMDESSDRTRGWGMGLKIVRSIVADLRGKIKVITQRGEGTTFFVTLPETPARLNAQAAA